MDRETKKKMTGLAALPAVVLIVLFILPGCGGEKTPPVSNKQQQKKPTETAKSEPEHEKKLPEFIEKKEFYPTKEIKDIYHVFRVEPDVRHKTYTEFYKSGKKKFQYTYDHNVKSGPLVFWYENEKKAMEGNFSEDKRDGEFKEYHPNGNLKLVYNYKSGLLEGTWIEYHEDGKTKMIEKHFKNDKLDGLLTYYTAEGKEKFHRYYKDGKLARGAADVKKDAEPPTEKK